MISLDELIKLRKLLLVIILRRTIDWEHTGRITDAKYLLSGELPVDITGKRCEKRNVLHMLLVL